MLRRIRGEPSGDGFPPDDPLDGLICSLEVVAPISLRGMATVRFVHD